MVTFVPSQTVFKICGRQQIFAGPVVRLKIFVDNVLLSELMVAGACAAPFWVATLPSSHRRTGTYIVEIKC
ncbi:hypothetical protein SEVIR_5G103401v4 [Setaria viridis]